MENSLVLCGGTGAHVSVAFLRLHTLGYALGFFDQEGKPFDFPKIFLVDQDAGDGRDRDLTAWQVVRSLVSLHPARYDWQKYTGSKVEPDLIKVTPLPIGANQQWYMPPHSTLESRFESSPLLSVLTSERQRRIDYSKGMMGSPSVGSLLFKLKEYDEREKNANHDETFGQLLRREGRVVVTGSGVGGTGASVGPTLARRLAEQQSAKVMAVMILGWFEFDVEEADDERRAKAQLRNRIMRENSHSALEFYGRTLAQNIAAVPVGMPERSLIERRYTSDVGQPLCESYVHAVGALCAARHFLSEGAYDSGLYIMGAVERGRLDGSTAIPGGTLQGLANQAATVVDLLDTWKTVLGKPQTGRVAPAIFEAVAEVAEPTQVAEQLEDVTNHYRTQLAWMRDTLSITGTPLRELTREAASRKRLSEERHGLEVSSETSPEQVALALFHWTTRWIRDVASSSNGLQTRPGEVRGGHWPDLRNESLGAAARQNGDLTRIPDSDIAAVLEAFVDPQYLSCNSWPHPMAAADYFRHMLEKRSPVAFRQLELLLVGLVTKLFQLRPLNIAAPAQDLSLEKIAQEYRRAGYEGLAEWGVFYPARGDMQIGFNSPHTLLCPVPFMDDAAGNRLWQELWERLSGASDGTLWSKAPAPSSWGENDWAVGMIRSWIEHQKRAHPGEFPPWTRLFEGYQNGKGEQPFGSGSLVRVYWGSANAPERPLVEVYLPTADVEDDLWVPPPGTQEMEESSLVRDIPQLMELRDERGNVYSMVEFEMPEREVKVRGWWKEHLDQLRQQGLIYNWSRAEDNAVLIAVLRDRQLYTTTLAHSHLLSRKAVGIDICTPLLQEPVPGSATPEGHVLYPDLPIKGDYLDLVQTSEGKSLMELARQGKGLRSTWQPKVSVDSQGRRRIQWSVSLRGRSTPFPVEIRLEDEIFRDLHKAHWMVWPRFRTTSGAGWKAYYIYEYCSDPRLFCDVLWLHVGVSKDAEAVTHLRCRQTEESKETGAYPLNFKTSVENPTHAGGPPLALSLRNTLNGQEQGLYLVHLESLPDSPLEVSMGIDFGTSHSIAAVRLEDGQSQPVQLLPELDPAHAAHAIGLHISESYKSHVEAVEENFGILALSSWLPTYRSRKNSGFLPSELLLRRPLEVVKAEQVNDWMPARDFTIPPMDIGRSKLADHLLTDFKWDADSTYFRGREKDLRDHYLGMFLELALAEIIWRRAKAFPSRLVNLTFTYPLRSTDTQVQSLRRSLERIVRRGRDSLGIPLHLKNDVGLFDESRAARVTTRNLGEVCVVADLGGGTLDLFIAADNGSRPPLPEVADSARIGGNILLHHIAHAASSYLPADGGWINGDARDTETKLRAWMRSHGSARLFGVDTGGHPTLLLGEATLSGFGKPAEAELARRLLDRYFRLIVEYLARNLVAYLARHWYPSVARELHDRLRISIQLRGNGWRLRYQPESYERATQAIRDQVRQRLIQLWPLVQENSYPIPSEERFWESADRYSVPDPKVAPVQNVVGQSMSFDEAKGRWHTHTLVDLEVQRGDGALEAIEWYTKVPFATGGSTHVQIQHLSPPLVLSHPDADRSLEISGLEADLQGRVNNSLQTEGVRDGEVNYRAPVAPLVWEAVFESKDFWPHKGGQ